MFQNTPNRSSYTPQVGPDSPNLLWRYPTVTNFSGAVIGTDGSGYVGNIEGQFLAFNPDGSLKWSFTTFPYSVESTPAILLDGRIAFVNSNGTLMVLNPDGSRSWRFATGVGCFCVETSPAVGRDGTIYFTDVETKLYALHPDGTIPMGL
jgi:outer membrane protein assembly factor BamB